MWDEFSSLPKGSFNLTQSNTADFLRVLQFRAVVTLDLIRDGLPYFSSITDRAIQFKFGWCGVVQCTVVWCSVVGGEGGGGWERGVIWGSVVWLVSSDVL